MQNRRVVVTGIGVISSVGKSKDEFFKSLKEGVCGIDLVTRFDTTGFDCKIAAEVTNFDPTLYIDKKEAKRMDRFSHFAIAASKQAIEDSGIDLNTVDSEMFGVCLGSGIGGMETLEAQHKILVEKGPGRVSPFMIPMMIVNIAAGNISISLNAKGPNSTVVTACASSTNAIGEAFRIIQRGDADIMLSGGSEASITPLSFAGFCSMKAMSTNNENPKGASRPFDKNRDGFVMGEGSGMLLLEDMDSAIKRGAKIYAEIVGYGSSGDAYHITSPAPGGEGAMRAMRMACKVAEITPDKVDYINAHGTSTDYNDRFETSAIKLLMGEDAAKKVSVSSTKSMTGHLLGAAGAIEAIACILAINESIIPPTINYETPDEECDLDITPNVAKERNVEYAMSNSLGFGGHNASIILKKFRQ